MERSERKALLGTVAYKHAHAGAGFITVAYVLRWLGAEPARLLQACYGVAWCAPGDSFSRKTGRQLALRRLARFLTTDASGAIGTLEYDDSGTLPLDFPEYDQLLGRLPVGENIVARCCTRSWKPRWAPGLGGPRFFRSRKKDTRHAAE